VRKEKLVRVFAPLVAASLAFVPAPVRANPVKSLYTTVDLKLCKRVTRHRDGAAWRCDGLPGYPVFIAEGDLRQFVSAGPDAEKRRAATQTLGSFNSIFERGSDRTTIEWRFDRRGERQIPYAIIVRFHTSADDRKGDVLVVAKVSATETCHVAYIDAQANDDAIALARRAADGRARNFDCKGEPSAEGATGRSPM
jgi:hypothetical protein